MRIRIITALFAALAGGLLWAEPKIAVLDAIVPKGIDQSVVVPVTEKIMERLVVSGRFMVLDRSNIHQVLKEREFQLSGLVSDAEVSEAGKYLGADFVVVSRVQRIAETYFLSAKTIAVKTGVIVNQASAQGEGKLSVLIAVAEQVGNALSGVNAEGNITGVIRPKVEASPVRNQVGLRLYAALGGGTQETSYGDTAYYYDPTGFGVYGLFGLWKNLCLTADVSYLSSVGDSGAATTSADVGVAYAFPVGRLFPWAGLKLGYMIMEWPDLSDYAETGLEYAFDVGMDLMVSDFLVGVRYQMQSAVFSKSSEFLEASIVQHSFWLMVGFRF